MHRTNSNPITVDSRGRQRPPRQRNSRCARGCGHKFYVAEMVCRTDQGDICLSCVTDRDITRRKIDVTALLDSVLPEFGEVVDWQSATTREASDLAHNILDAIENPDGKVIAEAYALEITDALAGHP